MNPAFVTSPLPSPGNLSSRSCLRASASKEVVFGDEARNAIQAGMNVVADAVRITLGPKGRNVVLGEKYGAPKVINDGVTIARDIELDDPVQNTGAKLLIQVAQKTNDVVGDGTTTATCLGQAMIRQGIRHLAAGCNPMGIRRGIQKAAERIADKIEESSQPVNSAEMIKNVASISSGSPELGSLISRAMEEVGPNGVTTVEENNTITDDIEITEGLEVDRGIVSPYLVKDPERGVSELENCLVLLVNKKISTVQEIIPVLEKAMKLEKPLLIIAEDISGEALTTMVINKARGVVEVAAIKSPGFGNRRRDILEDIAIMTGGTVIDEATGDSLAKLDDKCFGVLQKAIVKKEKTTLVATGKFKAQVEKRVQQISREMGETDSNFDREKMLERLGKLSGGVAVLKIGAATETEMKDKKLRVEDAINATKAAIASGILPGGGTTLVRMQEVAYAVADELQDHDEKMGAMVVAHACEAPVRQIAENSGIDGSLVVEKLRSMDHNVGYDAATGEYVDMIERGVIDPAQVTISALVNAASVAGMVLTTECVVVDKKEPGPPMGAAAPPMM